MVMTAGRTGRPEHESCWSTAMRRALLPLCLLCFGVLFSTAWPDEGKAKDKNPPAKVAAGKLFERLKSLSGDWELAKASNLGPKGKVMVRYRLTAGGSAVVETIFPDTNMEMMSVYHRDGEQLVMTHYCCAGNQPRMRARAGKDKDEVVFEFTGGGNLDPAKDPHIHGGLLRFVDADRLHSEWDFHVGGTRAEQHVFDLVRKK